MHRFYTPEIVAKLMIDLIPATIIPFSAIDICCGSWNLLYAVKNRFLDIKLSGIDIDKQSKTHAPRDSFFQCFDGRKFALKSLTNKKKYSLVVANPPFGKENLDKASLYNKLPGYSEMTTLALQRIETTMLLANLALVEHGGVLLAVVPSTLVDGDWAHCLRSYIANNYSLKCIINLPSLTFGRDISTSIIVIHNSRSSHKVIPVYQAEISNKKYKLIFHYSINSTKIKSGLWIQNVIKTANNVPYSIKRGRISNDVLVKSGKTEVIHSTDIINLINHKSTPTRFLPNSFISHDSLPYASDGDIAVIRVGRNAGLAAKVSTDKNLLISDCLYIIKTKDPRIWQVLNSSTYIKDLPLLRKGVTAKYITQNNLIQYINSKILMGEGLINDNISTQSICSG